DEAFLDVTGWVADGAQPERAARELKSEVRRETHLNVSLGVGTSKSVAKIASDVGKPDGLVVVEPGTEAQFLAPLPIRVLWGVGPKTEKVLLRAGLRKVGDIARLSEAAASRVLGSHGLYLREL